MIESRKSIFYDNQLNLHSNYFCYDDFKNENTIPLITNINAASDSPAVRKVKIFEGIGSILQPKYQVEEKEDPISAYIVNKRTWLQAGNIQTSSVTIINHHSDNKFPSNELAEYPYRLSKNVHQKNNINYFGFIKNRRTIFKVRVIEELKEYIQERVRTYISAIAFENIKDGISNLQISDSGKFLFPYSKELLTRIPIDPLDSKPFLLLLHEELTAFISKNGYKREWGELHISNNSLYLQLNSNSAR